jgi:N-acetyl-1-D-myo-inositol-2-amino-2-deoxy-alpha-D-glucopyranoside deacetylase
MSTPVRPSPRDLGLLCVHAHPDDETISTGGVLARYADEGMRTAVVTCTGGERGEIVGRGMNPDEIRPRLAERRHEELEAALKILGAAPARFLGYVDSGMMGEEGNDDENAFWRAPFDEAVGRLVGHIRELRPDVLVTYDAYGLYGHPDHIQAHRVAIAAGEAADIAALYPQAGPPWRVRKVYQATNSRERLAWFNKLLLDNGIPSPFGERLRPEDMPFGMPAERITTIVDVRPWLERKRAALLAHATQIGPDSLFLNIPDALLPQVFGSEWFVLTRSDVPAGEGSGQEDDLFAGLRG